MCHLLKFSHSRASNQKRGKVFMPCCPVLHFSPLRSLFLYLRYPCIHYCPVSYESYLLLFVNKPYPKSANDKILFLHGNLPLLILIRIVPLYLFFPPNPAIIVLTQGGGQSAGLFRYLPPHVFPFMSALLVQ